MHEHLFKVQEVATLLRVDPSTIRRWIKQGSLAAVSFPEKAGRQRQTHRIRQSVLDAIFASRYMEKERSLR